MRVATEGKITVCGTVTGSVELEQARDVRDTLDGARASNLVVENETAVLEHAVGYLSLPGHTDETASRVMPLVRFPLRLVAAPLRRSAMYHAAPLRSSPTHGYAGAQRGSG